MGVSCVIIVTKPPEGVHKSGETVNGILEYAIDEPTKYKDISISLIGKGEINIRKGTGDNSRNYRDKEFYVQRTINVLNKRPDEVVTLPYGSYKFPFQFHLPWDIPSTYSNKRIFGDVTGTWEINYCIIAVFVKPSLLSINKTCESNLIVYGIVNPIAESPLTIGIKKSITRINSLLGLSGRIEVIHLKATLENSYLSPGEIIKLNYEVQNDSDVDIRKIITVLMQRTTLTTNYLINTLEKEVKGCRNESHSIRNNTKRYMEVLLPTKPELYSIQHSSIINVEYFIRITVHLPLLHKNASVEVPIAIGEKHGRGALDVLELDDYNDNVDPPTYKQAVSEDNARFREV